MGDAAVVTTILKKSKSHHGTSGTLADRRDSESLSNIWTDFWLLRSFSSSARLSEAERDHLQSSARLSSRRALSNPALRSRVRLGGSVHSLPEDIAALPEADLDGPDAQLDVGSGTNFQFPKPHSGYSGCVSEGANSEGPEPRASDWTEAQAALGDSAYHNLLGGLRQRYRGLLRRRTNYVNLLSFVLFTALYAAILLFQRRAFLGYDIHKSLTYLLPKDGDGSVVSEFRGIASVHSWLDALVQDIWTNPICGDGVCVTSVEEAANIRFGCQEDCGWRADLQQVTIDLSYAFSSYSDRLQTFWNLCRPGTCSRFFSDPAVRKESCYYLDSGGFAYAEGNVSATVYLLALTEWELCVVSPSRFSPASGTISLVPLSQDERQRRASQRDGYLGEGPFDTKAANLNVNATSSGSGATRILEWAYNSKISPCHYDCLEATSCLARCPHLREVAESQLNMSLAPLFDVPAMTSLCMAQMGCDAQPQRRLAESSLASICEPALLLWVLLGENATQGDTWEYWHYIRTGGYDGPYQIDEPGDPDTVLLEGSHQRAPWFDGSRDDVVHLADLLRECYFHDATYGLCAPGCWFYFKSDDACDSDCLVESCNYDMTDCCTMFNHHDGLTDFYCAFKLGQKLQVSETVYLFHMEFTVPGMDGRPSVAVDNGTSASNAVTPMGPVGSSESEDFRWRMVGVTNRILGGIVIKQHRTPLQPAPFGKKFRWLFNVEFNTSDRAKPFGANPVFLRKSTLYVEDLAKHTREYFTSEQLTDQEVPFGFFPLLFHGRDIFPIYIDISKSQKEAKMWLEYLKEASFLDLATEMVEVEFVTYNGILKHFGLVAISFRRQPGGTVAITSTVEMFSLDMYNTPGERVRGVGEALLVLMVIAGTLFELQQVAVYAVGKGILHYLANIANLIDLASLSLFYVCIALWLRFLARYHGHLGIQLTYQPYRTDFTEGERVAKMLELANNGTNMQMLLETFDKVRDISWTVSLYTFLSALNLLFLIFRILKLTDFHPRLGIVTHTLARAMNDIAHYLLVASVLFLSFAVMAHLSFGTILVDFSTLLDSINTCFLMVIGEVGINEKLMLMEGLQLVMAWVFFWLYIIIMYFILINFFVAFIIDSFSDHINSGARSSTTVAQDMHDVFRDVARQGWELLTCRGGAARNDASVAAKLDALATLTAGACAAGTNPDGYPACAWLDRGRKESRSKGKEGENPRSKGGGNGELADPGRASYYYVEDRPKGMPAGSRGGTPLEFAVDAGDRPDGDGCTIDGVGGGQFPRRAVVGGVVSDEPSVDLGDCRVMRKGTENGLQDSPGTPATGGQGQESAISRLMSWFLPGRGWRARATAQQGSLRQHEGEEAPERQHKGGHRIVIDGRAFTQDELAQQLLCGMHALTLANGTAGESEEGVHREDPSLRILRAKAHRILFGSQAVTGGRSGSSSSKQANKGRDRGRDEGKGRDHREGEYVSSTRKQWRPPFGIPRGKMPGASRAVGEEADLESSQHGEGPGDTQVPVSVLGTDQGELSACHDLVHKISQHAIWRFGTTNLDKLGDKPGTAGMQADVDVPDVNGTWGVMDGVEPALPENPTVQVAHMVGELQAQLMEMQARWLASMAQLGRVSEQQQQQLLP